MTSQILNWPPKDPDENLDYDIDWTDRLVLDQIQSSSWAVAEGSVVIGTITNSTTIAKVWLSGGTDGDICLLTNTIVTVNGRTMQQSVRLRVKSR